MGQWMVCSACRSPIAFGAKHFTCSVSTCNRERTRLVFCSVACWDSHVAVLRHRDAWAVEATAPAEGEAPQPEAAPVRRVVTSAAPTPAAPGPQLADADASDILIVVSKMKKYIKERSGMNTSDAVAEGLSDHVRALCDQAIRTAASDGRKTVLDRDVPPLRR